jgi:Asp/Glu/hydantoin racemase
MQIALAADSGAAARGAPLGILMLETRFARVPGDMGNALTWPFPVLYRVVRGASPQRVVREAARGLLPDFISAAQDLANHGVEAITTSCGFLAIFQRELAAAVKVPVATSALMQVGAVQALLPPGRRVGVLTIDARGLSDVHLRAAGVPLDAPRIGVENGCELHRVLVRGEKDELDAALAEQDVLDAGRRLVSAHPEVGAVVLECTNMPPYAAALRAELKLPVFDIYSMIAWLHAGLRPRVFALSNEARS